MPLSTRRVLDRVVLENMAHGGAQNGDLIVTYDDFVRFGLSSRRATAVAIRTAVDLGFLDVVERGHRSYGGVRRPSRYRLTWLDACDGGTRSNRWRAVTTRAQAEQIVRRAREKPQPVDFGWIRRRQAATA